MPLIRYRTGDLVEQGAPPGGTEYLVHGRASDMLLGADGERATTWQIDRCFETATGIAHYQLRQDPHGRWNLCFLPDRTAPSPDELAELRFRLELLLGLKLFPISFGSRNSGAWLELT